MHHLIVVHLLRLEVYFWTSKVFARVWHEVLTYKLQSLRISGLPLKCMERFLSNRFQRVLLNGQSSSWSPVLAGVPQGSVLGPLLFSLYINDLSKNLSSTAKLFADDTSIFSVVHDISLSLLQLNDDLVKISNWAYQWKMPFNPEVTKQAQEVVSSRKSQKVTHPTVYFNNSPVTRSSSQKHLGIHLDKKLNFVLHIKEKISKTNKGIGIIKKVE